MELKKSFDFHRLFVFLYIFAFLVYIIYGLVPVAATNYDVSAKVEIPAINLISDVATLKLEAHALYTPDNIVGSFSRIKDTTLLIGHSTTIFKDLAKLNVGDEVFYDFKKYVISKKDYIKKEEIDMDKLLKSNGFDSIILMTCAGELYDDGDASHRLILTAKVE